jgi:tetratricopeptide (TPR) repeat protein
MEPAKLSTREEQEAFVDAALARGEALRRSGEVDEGIRVLVDALRHQIQRAAIYFRLGNLYVDKGDLEHAEDAYHCALEVDPDHANALHNLAVVYKRQKRIHLFVKTYKEIQRRPLRPSLASTLRQRGKPFTRSYGFWLVVAVAVVVLVLVLLPIIRGS